MTDRSHVYCFDCYLPFFWLTEKFALIYWPAEESVSVVRYKDVTKPTNPVVGCESDIKVGMKTYPGRLAAVGK